MNQELGADNLNQKPANLSDAYVSQAFEKNIYQNGKLKKTEHYDYQRTARGVVQTGGKYYLDVTETLDQAMSECIKGYSNRWTFYYDCQTNAAGDNLWTYQTYRWDQFTESGHQCFDHKGRLIAHTWNRWGETEFPSCLKYFYGDPAVFDTLDPDDYAILFYYSENLPSRVLCNYGAERCEQYSIDQFLDNEDIMSIFLWPDHPYFHQFEPMLPSPLNE
jgi:hypothetical protein